MNFKSATLTELYTIAAWDDVSTFDKWQAMHEIVRRQQKTRKPYKVNQQRVKAQYPK